MTTLAHGARRLVQAIDAGHANLEPGVTRPQWMVLCALYDNPGLSQTGLVTTTGIDRSTITNIVDLTVQRGYVRRCRTKSDRRRYACHLTPEGKDLVRTSRAKVAKAHRAAVAGLSDDEYSTLCHLLDRIEMPQPQA